MNSKEIEDLKTENERLRTELEKLRSLRQNQKKGMAIKASKGNPVTRAPWGYKFENKELVPSEHSQQVEELFQEFLSQKISLTKLAKKYDFSVNGLKKILTNFTYVGKVRFAGEMHQGSHQQLVSSTLFNHVQNKMEKLGIGQKIK